MTHFDVSEIKAGQLLTSRVTILYDIIKNGIDGSVTKIHGFFHAAEEASANLVLAVLQEQHNTANSSSLPSSGSIMTLVSILGSGLLATNGTTVMWAATALTALRLSFNDKSLHVPGHVFQRLWQWFKRESEQVEELGGFSHAVRAIGTFPSAASSLSDFISAYSKDHLIELFSQLLPGLLEAELAYLHICHTFLFHVHAITSAKTAIVREGLLQYVLGYSMYVIANSPNESSKKIASSLLAFLWYSFSDDIPDMNGMLPEPKKVRVKKSKRASRTGWEEHEVFNHEKMMNQQYGSTKKKKPLLGGKDILGTLKKCCRNPAGINLRIDVIANLFDLVSKFSKKGMQNQANLIFKSLVFTTVENIVSSPGQSFDLIVGFLFQNLKALVDQECSLDVRELCVLFSQQSVKFYSLPEYYALWSAVANHSSLAGNDVSVLILGMYRHCIVDEENHFIVNEILIKACNRITKSTYMRDILEVVIKEGCEAMLKGLRGGRIGKANLLRKKEYIKSRKNAKKERQTNSYAKSQNARNERPREQRKINKTKPSSEDDSERENGIGYGIGGTMILHTIREMVHLVPEECLTKKLLAYLKSFATKELEIWSTLTSLRSQGGSSRPPKFYFSIRLIIEDIRQKMNNFLKPIVHGGETKNPEQMISPAIRHRRLDKKNKSPDTPAHILAGAGYKSKRPKPKGSSARVKRLAANSSPPPQKKRDPVSNSPKTNSPASIVIKYPLNNRSKRIVKYLFHKMCAASKEIHFKEKSQYVVTNNSSFDDMKPIENIDLLSFADWLHCLSTLEIVPRTVFKFQAQSIFNKCSHADSGSGSKAMDLSDFLKGFQLLALESTACNGVTWPAEKYDVLMNYIRPNTLGLLPLSLWNDEYNSVINFKELGQSTYICKGIIDILIHNAMIKLGIFPPNSHAVSAEKSVIREQRRLRASLRKREVAAAEKDTRGMAKTGTLSPELTPGEKAEKRILREMRRTQAAQKHEKTKQRQLERQSRGAAFGSTVNDGPSKQPRVKMVKISPGLDSKVSAASTNTAAVSLKKQNTGGSTKQKIKKTKIIVDKSPKLALTELEKKENRIRKLEPRERQVKYDERQKVQEEEKIKEKMKRDSMFKAKSESTKAKLNSLKAERKKEKEDKKAEMLARKEMHDAFRAERAKKKKQEKLEKERRLQAYKTKRRMQKAEDLERRRLSLEKRKKETAAFIAKKKREMKKNEPQNNEDSEEELVDGVVQDEVRTPKDPKAAKADKIIRKKSYIGKNLSALKSSLFKRFSGRSQASAIKAFKKYDVDDSKFIDYEEFQKLCEDLKVNLTKVEVREAMGHLDENNDGTIQEEEFVAWFANLK
jgi:hypothetical protein